MARIVARRRGRVTRCARTLIPAVTLLSSCDSGDPSSSRDNIVLFGVLVVGVAIFLALDR